MPREGIECNDEENINRAEEVQYTTFRDTYKIITFAMVVGMIYPNPENATRRLACILASILSIVPISFIILLDIYESWLRRDIVNIIRHCTIVGPLLAVFFKILIFFYKRDKVKQLIDDIDRDYAIYNRLPLSHKRIVDCQLRDNLVYSERCWSLTVCCCVVSYPGIAVVLNIYNNLFADDPVKYMAHDMNKPFSPPEERLESPFFEAMFAYLCYGAVFYLVNFTGFDGFFGLVINHACLKMTLYCKTFEDAMRAKDEADIRKGLKCVIEEQKTMFRYVGLIQDTFNIWLGMILIATMIQICNCMYQITEANELDPRFVMFVMATTVQIYLPCQYSSKLKDTALATASALYCGGWERVRDAGARRTLLVMIMRAQAPLEITAFNLLVFDMELFVSLLKTSYSMYTLLRS